MNAVLALGQVVSANSGGFQGPSIDDFFPASVLFAGTPFALDRVLLVRLFGTAVIIAILWIGSTRLKVVPTRAQAAWEFLMDMPRQGIVYDTLGKKDGDRFMPILLTMFFGTLAWNLTGTIPGLQIASTGLIGQALLMAAIAYVTFIYAGIRKHGTGHFFKNTLWLPGVPIAIKPVIALLEFLSTFIVRPVTLTLRLTMNMVAGHMLLALCFLATNFFFFSVLGNGNALGFLGIGTFAFGIAFTVLELFIGVLQAYIFAILSAIYIQMALADEH
ncbi:MAG: F0F1 ATP synthase subunit A [Microbacteriaceae bacterium]|nr:F0F1 ATP synthase subunit A [Microbacteriaceae bacterium]